MSLLAIIPSLFISGVEAFTQHTRRRKSRNRSWNVFCHEEKALHGSLSPKEGKEFFSSISNNPKNGEEKLLKDFSLSSSSPSRWWKQVTRLMWKVQRFEISLESFCQGKFVIKYSSEFLRVTMNWEIFSLQLHFHFHPFKSQDRMVFTTSAITTTSRSSHHLIQFRFFPSPSALFSATNSTFSSLELARGGLNVQPRECRHVALTSPERLIEKMENRSSLLSRFTGSQSIFQCEDFSSHETQLDAFWRFFLTSIRRNRNWLSALIANSK